MIGALQNLMRLQALRAFAGGETLRVGLVTNYDPNTYSVKVTLQPEGIKTGWLPLMAIWAGNGWGMYAPPSINEMVSVAFFGESIDAGIILGPMFNDVDRPIAVQSGELWLVHAMGQSITLTNDGKLSFTDSEGATVTMNGDGTMTSAATTWNHTGDVNVTGKITASVDVMGGGKSLLNHVHGGITTGTSNTGPPV